MAEATLRYLDQGLSQLAAGKDGTRHLVGAAGARTGSPRRKQSRVLQGTGGRLIRAAARDRGILHIAGTLPCGALEPYERRKALTAKETVGDFEDGARVL